MTKPLFLLVFTFIMSQAMAQTITGNAVPTVQFSDVNGRIVPMGNNGIQGSPYLFENFGMGILIMSNGMEAIDSNLNYSLFDHKLYFLKNKSMYLVNQPVKSFELNSLDKDNNRLVKIFFSGYPSIENNTANTFYELITEGEMYQLLKYASKYIKESTVYGSAPIKEYTTDHIYCVYDKAAKKMLLVGSTVSLKNLKKTLPEKASQLDQFISSMQLNLKKEADVKRLFEKLN